MLPDACLPPTGLDNWTIMLLVVIAAVLLAAGAIAIGKTRGRIALILAPLALLGAVVAAPAQPAQAFEAAYPSFEASDTWTITPDPGFDYLSENPTADQTTFLTEVEALVTQGPAYATRSTTLVLVSQNGLNSTPLALTWYNDDTDGSVIVPNEAVQAGIIALNVQALNAGYGNLTLTLTHTFDYFDSCQRPLQTLVTYTGTVVSTPPVP